MGAVGLLETNSACYADSVAQPGHSMSVTLSCKTAPGMTRCPSTAGASGAVQQQGGAQHVFTITAQHPAGVVFIHNATALTKQAACLGS